MTKSKKPPSLAEIVDGALPRCGLKVDRAALAERLVEEIKRWQALDLDVGPHYERVRAAARIADKLDRQIDAAAGALRRLGVDADIRALGITGPWQPLGGLSAALDLYLVAWQAADGIRRWNAVHKPPRGRAPATASALTSRLLGVFKMAGMSQLDSDDVLGALSGQGGLPILARDTLKKRRVRARKRERARGTK